jgi:glucokinase
VGAGTDDHRPAIGIDLGGTKIAAGVVDASGEVLRRVEVATDVTSSEAIVRQVTGLATELARDRDVIGIGIGIPAAIDQEAGSIFQSVNLPMSDLPVRSLVAEATGLRVEIDNDASCAALGEGRHGAARQLRSLILLTLGTGVGGGAVIDGRLMRGRRGAGTEFGHVPVSGDGRACQGACNGRDHLESYCSGTAIGAEALFHARMHESGPFARAAAQGRTVDARLVLDLDAEGDPDAAAILDAAAERLGSALAGFANVFAPDVILIGGGFGAAAGARLLPLATRVMRYEALPPMSATPISLATLGPAAGLVGAAELLR